MPSYFFHVNGRASATPVTDGLDLADAAAARREAARVAAALLVDEPDAVWVDRHWEVEVQDRQGGLVGVMSISATVPTKDPSIS